MKYRSIALATVATLALVACGGSDSDSDNTSTTEPDPEFSDDDAPAESEFAASSLTSEEICTALPNDELQALFDFAEFFDADPSFLEERSACDLAAYNGDASQLVNPSIEVANEGGQAGFDDYVADWGTRADVADVAGIGDAAASVENSSVRQVVVLDGDRVIVVSGPSTASFGFTPEIAQAMATVAADAL